MSEVISTAPITTQPVSNPVPETSVEVFAVYGVEPAIQAYAMAKYSRSSLSMKESLKEITLQKAEKFLNTFYFQYGHRSIADLAHIALAIERLSILAAIVVADEQRWDGQERSTRYQDFRKSGYYTPNFGDAVVNGEPGSSARALYRETIDSLFATYEKVSQRTFEYLASITPRPAEMKPDAYERTLRARAFDISRYLLPLATNTSLGEIVNARTLESQVSHLLSHTHREVRGIGEQLKHAATSAAYDVNHETLRKLVEEIRGLSPELGARAEAELLKEVRVAPTLVKYADPNSYEIQTRLELRQMASELLPGKPELAPAGALETYRNTMDTASAAVHQLASSHTQEARENSEYVIALGFRKRTLFKMDFAEAVYISELRTGPAGHFSYRNVAYAMYEEVKKKFPALASFFRVHDVRQPVDLLQR